MLDDPQLDRWQIEHLPDLFADHPRLRQITPTRAARRRLVHHDLIGNQTRLQASTRLAGPLARLAPRLLPQRPRRRLDERIRRRRLRRVLRVLTQPGLKLRNPRRQRLGHPVTLGENDQQLLHGGDIGNRRQLGPVNLANGEDATTRTQQPQPHHEQHQADAPRT